MRLSEIENGLDDFYRESGMRNFSVSSLSKLRLETQDDDERRFLFTRKIIAGKRVLDFGCGDGGYILKAKQVANYVAGVELEKAVREALLQEGIPCFPSIKDAEYFDVITMFHVLEHLPDPLAILNELFDHLTDNGLLLIEVPNANDALLSLYKCQAFADFTYWICHVYLYTSETLGLLAKKAGLETVFMEQIQRYPLSNHLYWLTQGKPGGHSAWSFLHDDILTNQYGSLLARLGIADTIIAGFRQKK